MGLHQSVKESDGSISWPACERLHRELHTFLIAMIPLDQDSITIHHTYRSFVREKMGLAVRNRPLHRALSMHIEAQER